MKIHKIDGKAYRLPNELNDFQFEMYIHLINWKWANLTMDPGYFKGVAYDALLPEELEAQYFPLYPPIKERFLNHQQKFPFRLHEFLGHMASSQAACVNLFLPLLEDPSIAAQILGKVKLDLKEIATDRLDNGFRIEFWDEPDNLLNDHTSISGTDADIAIAYYDHEGNLNLWLIEHKLTEREFTTCGGYKSNGRTSLHKCEPMCEVVENPNFCYYQNPRSFRYWDITLGDSSPFNINLIREYDECPFKGGLNQLWRNQLLAAGLESSTSPRWPYKKVYFSVVYHPGNNSLKPSISKFQELIGLSDRFFAFSSDKLISHAKELNEPALSEWLNWYTKLYYI